MSTLEDKLLGEKLHYYCDSSEDERDGKDSASENGSDNEPCTNSGGDFYPAHDNRWDGCSVNTGPKGVIKDWQRFKQIEAEKRAESEKEKEMLIKKLSITCQTESSSNKTDVDKELDELLDENDSVFKEYMKRRMEEMLESQRTRHEYGKLMQLLSGDEFLNAIDKNMNKDVTVICHVYSRGIPGCKAMNGCLACLAEDYHHIKFCCVESSAVGMSQHFSSRGVPALLIYKNGNLIGNFVRLTKEFGDDFFSTDVEAFLVEHGFLPDPSLVPEIVKTE